MSHVDIIRAWKDEEYRLSLSDAEGALLPDHPAGLIELTDTDLGAVAGGMRTNTQYTQCGDPTCAFLCSTLDFGTLG